MATPDKKQVALKMLEVAQSYLGYNRADNESEIARWLELFGLPFEEGGVPVPFCDAGASWCGVKAYCETAGIAFTGDNALQVFRHTLPTFQREMWFASARCADTQQMAKQRGQWLDTGDCEGANGVDILPGWLVLYSWQDGDQADHIEIVEADADDVIHTIAFNTSGTNFRNGGTVARKARDWAHILGFVKTH